MSIKIVNKNKSLKKQSKANSKNYQASKLLSHLNVKTFFENYSGMTKKYKY